MAGSLSGELFGLSGVCLAQPLFLCGLVVVELRVSLLLNPANPGCQEHWTESLVSSPAGAGLSRTCRLAHLAIPSVLSWHPIRSQDYSLKGGGSTARRSHWLGVCHSSILVSLIGLLTALFLMEAPFLRSQRHGTLTVAAVAVNLCTKEVWQPGCEVKACLGELKFSGGRETARRRPSDMKGLKCIRKSTKKSYLYLSPFPFCISDVRENR